MDIERIPPVTLAFLLGALGTSLLVQCNIATPYQLFYSPKSVFVSGQAWRLVTNFLYFGTLSIDFAFHLFFFLRYSKSLETGPFSGRPADFVYMLLVFAALLLLLAPFSNNPFLSAPLSFAVVYIWSRLNPHMRLSLFGAITITAPNLPYALVLLSWALNTSWSAVVGDLLGIAVGHIYYFFVYIWRHEVSSDRRNWLRTPYALVRLIQGQEEVDRRKRVVAETLAQREADRKAILQTMDAETRESYMALRLKQKAQQKAEGS